MKKSILKTAIIGILSMFMIISVNAQTKTVAKTKVRTKARTKAIDKEKVPGVVIDEFVKEYPIIESDFWYGYPTLVNKLEWFEYNPMYYTYQYPEYYIVDFVKDKIKYKAAYTKDGKKATISYKAKIIIIPAAINTTLKNGAYKTWKETDAKEEIENVTTKEKVYKITMKKGTKKHYLYFDNTGKLLKKQVIKKI